MTALLLLLLLELIGRDPSLLVGLGGSLEQTVFVYFIIQHLVLQPKDLDHLRPIDLRQDSGSVKFRE